MFGAWQAIERATDANGGNGGIGRSVFDSLKVFHGNEDREAVAASRGVPRDLRQQTVADEGIDGPTRELGSSPDFKKSPFTSRDRGIGGQPSQNRTLHAGVLDPA